MNRIIEQVKNNIYDYDMIQDNDVIVVGVSGGPDSIFLLHALSILKDVIKKEKSIVYTLHIAHINHKIREEAVQDANIAKKFADSVDAKFHLLEFEVEKEAAKLKIGTEECGRNIRYEFFNQVAKTINATKIAVAHNAGDNAETIMLNFIRGTGISGLTGMDYVNGKIIRPMLNIPKEEIVEYLKTHNIQYAIDRTNLENDYTRNKVRNDLIGKIEKEYNPNFITAINRMAEINKKDEEIINNSVDEKYSELRLEKNENQIKITDIKSFNLNTEAMRYRLIRKILTELIGNIQGIEMIHIKDTCKLLESRITGKQYILGNKYRVVIEKKNVAMFTTSK